FGQGGDLRECRLEIGDQRIEAGAARRGRGHQATSRRSCGSSASRRPSPRKLKQKSVSESARPGKMTSHGNKASTRAPSDTSVPHEASGGWTPSPRNERNASCRMIAGTVSVV